jgi:hypothetical protein
MQLYRFPGVLLKFRGLSFILGLLYNHCLQICKGERKRMFRSDEMN